MQRCAFCQGDLDPATLICRACGRVQPPADDDITLPLGARRAPTRHCPNCNTLLPVSARFCGRCGQMLVPLTDGAAGKEFQDTYGAPESDPRDEEITAVLNQPIKLADTPAGPPASPQEHLFTLPGPQADAPAETQKVFIAEGRAGGSALPRPGLDTRPGRSGLAHGMRYRLLSRMQARVVVAALALLLLIGGAAASQTFLSAGPLGQSAHTTPTNPVVLATATLAPGKTSLPTPTDVVTAGPTLPPLFTPTATSTPPAGAFRVTPVSFSQTCAGSAALPPLQISLVNSYSFPITWQVIISQTDPQGHIWATANPASGTVSAGQTMQLTIIPISTLCQDIQGSSGTVNYSVTVYTLSGKASSQNVIDTITPPA